MRTKFNKYKRPLTISCDDVSCQKLDKLMTANLMDRSNVVRIILRNITLAQFDKLKDSEIKMEKKKELVKMKINRKRAK